MFQEPILDNVLRANLNTGYRPSTAIRVVRIRVLQPAITKLCHPL